MTPDDELLIKVYTVSTPAGGWSSQLNKIIK